MSSLADFLARRLWWSLLWLMRRPWMRRFQDGAFRLVPEKRRPGALRNHYRQNAFARRYGLRGLRLVILAFLASVSLTVIAYTVLLLLDAGLLVQPEFPTR